MSRVILAVVAVALMCLVAAPPARAVDITVDGNQRFQTIEGFGTCLVAWRDEFRQLYRNPAFQRIYVNDLGMNMLRVNMWGPVYDKPARNPEDIRYQDFNPQANNGRPQIFVDFAKGIRKLNPDVKIIGTVWSPPAWMKVNQSITDTAAGGIRAGGYDSRRGRQIDNRVDPRYFRHFVQWMIEYMKWHREQGVEFYAVSPGNEVQFTQSFESAVWSGEDYARIIGMLGEAMEAQGFGDVLIFGPETMTSHFYEGGTPQYLEAVMNDPVARKSFDVAATHGYEDGFAAEMEANSSARMWDFVSQWNLPLWMTEGGTGGHDWPEPLHKGVAAAIHNALVAGHVSAFVPWQVTGGEPSTHDLMVMTRKTPKTYAAMHYFRFIPAGAQRIAAEPAFGAVKASAYHDPESGQLSIVLINPSSATQPVTLTLENVPAAEQLKAYRTMAGENLERLDPLSVDSGKATLELPAESMVTLTTGPGLE